MGQSPALWTDLQVLQNLGAHLRLKWQNQTVFRVAVGPDWLRLHLVGDDRPGLVLSSRPGCNFMFAMDGTWSEAVKQALPVAKGHLLGQQLTGSRLVDLGILPKDRVLALHFLTTDEQPLYLLHQMFGQRGNTTLLDRKGHLLWARHKVPHPRLSEIPTTETWNTGESKNNQAWADELFAQMLDSFKRRLANDLFVQQQSTLKRVATTTDRLVSNLRRDLETADKGDQYRRWAEALAANLHNLKQGQETAEIHDLQDGTPISIALDPALSPAGNMEGWFRKARKADKGHDIIAANLVRSEELQSRQQAAQVNLENIGLVVDDEEKLVALHLWTSDHSDLLPVAKSSIGKHSTGKHAAGKRAHIVDEPVRPFRRYLIDGKWEVWVGRNNKENDKLTHRVSHSKDIWLHAQGVAGSHVVLRTAGQPDQIPKTVIEKAAALAALHSKAKHSSLVPVIYTEKRFVRKPRKSPPGLAVCLQEKNIFVEPGVPAGVESI